MGFSRLVRWERIDCRRTCPFVLEARVSRLAQLGVEVGWLLGGNKPGVAKHLLKGVLRVSRRNTTVRLEWVSAVVGGPHAEGFHMPGGLAADSLLSTCFPLFMWLLSHMSIHALHG